MKRKGNIVIIVLILVMIVTVIGVSYAAFSYSKTGTKVNSITTGSITMTYEESDNVINIDKALPTTDETGKVRLKEGEYFDFTVSSEIVGDININYEISAKDVTVLEGNEKKIDGSNIKLYLTRLTDDGEEELMIPETYNEETTTNSYTGRPANEMSLYTSSMSSSETNRYRLRMYVDEGYNPQGDGGNLKFAVKINVYGKDGLSMEDRMMRTAGSADFHSSEYKSKVTSIVTKGDTEIPEGVIESWDISEKQNGSVIAYAEDDGTGSGTYKLTIGGEGSVIANSNMSQYFDGFSNCTTMDLSYLNTSLTTDMSYMFGSIASALLGTGNQVLNNIIFDEYFDTSNVISMEGMFYDCRSLTELDLTNFDTSNVTDMSYMFAGSMFASNAYMSLTKVVFGEKFDTSNVTSMAQMFSYCRYLNNLDISSFNTNKVTLMSQMFYGCRSLTELDLSNFDTSNVTSMSQMFQHCEKLIHLDLTSFDTSSVTNCNSMFQDMTNITEIRVTRDKWTIPNSTIANSGVTDFTYV